MLQDIQLPIRQINNFQKQRLSPTAKKHNAIFQTTRHKAIKMRVYFACCSTVCQKN